MQSKYASASAAAITCAGTDEARSNASTTLISAALAGLLSVGMAGCDDENENCASENDAGEDLTPWDSGTPEEDEQDASGADRNADGGAGALASGPETLREVEGDRALASLKTECDMLAGYMQVHASCSGSNDCAGFSYGDWDPGVYTEHTCAGANGCKGASCVVLPKDSGKTAEEILFAEELPSGGPQPCWFCHAESTKQADGSYLADKTQFKVWVPKGSTRTAQNWLELSPQAQAAMIAFGTITRIGEPGQEVASRSMKGYHKLYSRAEIDRVVAHLRKMIPVIKVIEAPK